MPAIQAITLDWGDTIAANAGMPHRAAQRHGLERLGADLATLGCPPPGGWVEDCVARSYLEQWESTIDDRLNPEHRDISFDGLLNGWLGKADALGAETAWPGHARSSAFTTCSPRSSQPYGPTMAMLVQLKARGLTVGILSHVPLPGPACRAWPSPAIRPRALPQDFWPA